MEKITFDEIKQIQFKSEVVMGETPASIPADGMSIEEAFLLYIKAMSWAEGDRFFRQVEDNDLEEYECEY